MKIFFIFLMSCVITLILDYLNISTGINTISTLYNTIGIVFAIGMGLIVTFSIHGIENKDYILCIRKNIKQIRQKFIFLFFICTILFIFKDDIHSITLYNIDFSKIASNFILSFFLLSIIYFIINFILLQNLNNDIFDRLLQEKSRKH